ncbi:MAG TPA: hypothetical protein VI893_09265, partial [Thermoplasmata archaeon]|nr:hypothetical protein [Thermoplasmata archaeon]
MQKGPASTLIAVLALVALVLATIVPASATAAPSEVKASQPSTEMGQTAAGKVVDCDRPQSGRVAGAKITLYEEWVVWINNNTTIEKRPFTGNARVANSNGEWDVFL